MRALRVLLRPFASGYGVATRARNALFDCGVFASTRVGCPVLSVGNLTVGGNAKTPLTILIVSELKGLGFRPFVVSRGYGGAVCRPTEVREDSDARVVGDEPLLIRRRTGAGVVVAKRRVDGVRFALQQELGDVAVLDDALQHRWIARDLDLISIACDSAQKTAEFLAGALLPEGEFREDRDRGLARAHAIVWANRGASTASLAEGNPVVAALVPAGLPQFNAHLISQGIYSLPSGERVRPKSVVAFCGIAGPEGFWSTLERGGVELVARYAFADHHYFSERELSFLRDASNGQPLVCTEKDAVRIPPKWRENVFELRTELLVEPKELFAHLLVSAIERRRKESNSGA